MEGKKGGDEVNAMNCQTSVQPEIDGEDSLPKYYKKVTKCFLLKANGLKNGYWKHFRVLKKCFYKLDINVFRDNF